jgi:hypothetical protein
MEKPKKDLVSLNSKIFSKLNLEELEERLEMDVWGGGGVCTGYVEPCNCEGYDPCNCPEFSCTCDGYTSGCQCY